MLGMSEMRQFSNASVTTLSVKIFNEVYAVN